MRKIITRFTAVALSAAMSLTMTPVMADAATMSELMPVAGVARALNEGKSVTVVKADIIKKNAPKGSEIKEVIEETENRKDSVLESVHSEKSNSTIKEVAGTSDPSLIVVGAEAAASSETITETTILESAANLESAMVLDDEDADVDVDDSQEGEYAEEESEDYEDDDEGYTAGQNRKNHEDEDFSNLVIARVNDYVNVRSEASEDSEIVGKLYNKSVGDLIEEEGDWYKIRSGNCTGYVKGEYVVTGEEAIELAKEVGTRMAVVTTTTLYVRNEPSTEAGVIGMVPIEDELLVMEELDGWAKVSVEEGDGYVSTDFVRLYTEFVRAESKEEEEARIAKEEAERKAAEEAARRAKEKQKKQDSKKKGSTGGYSPTPAQYAVSGSGTGSSVASYALQFVGNPYVYGGSSLTNGTDCSGFVMSVYRNFGVNLPHSSGGDRGVGRDVGGLANAQAGDIVCYSGHVGIYIGGGQIVHASTPSTGIKVSNANYRTVLAVRRIF